MSDSNNDNMKFVLFNNTGRKHDRSPDMIGHVVIDGVKFSLAAWNNTARSGTQYLSGRVSAWVERTEGDQKTDLLF